MNKNIFLFNFSNSDFISDESKINMRKYLKSNKFNILDLNKIKKYIIDNYLIKIHNINYDLKFDMFNDNIKVTLIKNTYISKANAEKPDTQANAEKPDTQTNAEKPDTQTNAEKPDTQTNAEKNELKKKLKNKIKNIKNKRTQHVKKKNIPENISNNKLDLLNKRISQMSENEQKKIVEKMDNVDFTKSLKEGISNIVDNHKKRRIDILYNILKQNDENIPKKEDILKNKDTYINKIFENVLSLSVSCKTKDDLHKKMNTHYMNYLQEVCEFSYKSYLDEFLKKIKQHVHVLDAPKLINDIKDYTVDESELDENILNRLQDSDSDKEIEIDENI